MEGGFEGRGAVVEGRKKKCGECIIGWVEVRRCAGRWTGRGWTDVELVRGGGRQGWRRSALEVAFSGGGVQ